MSNVDIDDPIDLEEKALDLRYRAQHLEQELMLLRSKNGEVGNRVRGAEARKKAMEQILAEKVKALENQVVDKQICDKGEDQVMDDKIRTALMAKDQVY